MVKPITNEANKTFKPQSLNELFQTKTTIFNSIQNWLSTWVGGADIHCSTREFKKVFFFF